MNKVYLLDTNIISEFTKDNPNQKVLALYTARKNMCAISAVTWQELVFGLSKMPEGKRKNYLKQCFELYEEEFEIIPYDGFAAKICGQLSGQCAKEGKPPSLLRYSDCGNSNRKRNGFSNAQHGRL